ncbi:MEGF10_11 [Mytilus coruscus]|uniref:MEGF10_11 n=1 Tax=Mytilus coruscus TaxID=42192 RepID=A0A6J8AJU9_MYTCO|nr:MEGF10_11 [Mytilus coruscus]
MPTKDILEMIKLVLEGNNFRFMDRDFLQNEGVAIGSKLGKTLACTYMRQWEKAGEVKEKPLLYKRFIDDGFGIWTHGEEMDFANSTYDKIKVELRYDSMCPIGKYGINCTGKCLCAQDAKCDSVTGDCVYPAGWFGDNSRMECHLGYYDYNNNYNCSKTCVCIDGALCNTKSGICECEDNTSCINIRKKLIPSNISSNYMNRNLFIVVVTITVSFNCVLLLVLTYLLLWRYLKHRHNRSSHDNVIETRSVQGHYNESNHYSEIRDDQLQDIRRTSSGMIENDNSQYRFQQTTNREHGY